MNHADVTLIEADGLETSVGKYPELHEPVIYPYSTKIILVMGLWTPRRANKRQYFVMKTDKKIWMAGRGCLDILKC